MSTEQTSAPIPHRVLPQSHDAELGLLGSILLSPSEVMEMCIERRIDTGSFHNPAHALVFGRIREMVDTCKPVDFILLTAALRNAGELDKIGGASFVTNMFTFVPTAANAEYYAGILAEKQIMRGVITTCTEFAAKGYEDTDDAMAFLDTVEARVHAIAERHVRCSEGTIKEHAMAALDAIEALYERRGGVSGLTTGFPDLDQTIDGLTEPDMIVIAARPSCGKTALAMNIAEHVALESKLPVGVFSLEMSAQQLTQRMICSRAKVNTQRVREGFLSERDFNTLSVETSRIAASALFIDDTPGLSILELRTKGRRMKKSHDIRLIVIDYLQLLKAPKKGGGDNREREIAEISGGIKSLAKELKIPIIVLAQLNRNPEGRAGGKPRLSDLRESGSIEQDADIVGLLSRSEMYAAKDEKESVSGQAVLDIAKNRNGPLGEVEMTFQKQFTRFTSRAKIEPS